MLSLCQTPLGSYTLENTVVGNLEPVLERLHSSNVFGYTVQKYWVFPASLLNQNKLFYLRFESGRTLMLGPFNLDRIFFFLKMLVNVILSDWNLLTLLTQLCLKQLIIRHTLFWFSPPQQFTQILYSIFLSTSIQLAQVVCFFLELIDRCPHWSELLLLHFWAKIIHK